MADITKPIPFEDDTFDVVMLANVLEHVPYPNAVLAECFRVLRPGGRIIGITPFIMGLHDVPYDFLRYTRHALGRYLQDAGFRADRDEGLQHRT